jgi:hypothetical protein
MLQDLQLIQVFYPHHAPEKFIANMNKYENNKSPCPTPRLKCIF